MDMRPTRLEQKNCSRPSALAGEPACFSNASWMQRIREKAVSPGDGSASKSRALPPEGHQHRLGLQGGWYWKALWTFRGEAYRVGDPQVGEPLRGGCETFSVWLEMWVLALTHAPAKMCCPSSGLNWGGYLILSVQNCEPRKISLYVLCCPCQVFC
jgi:hypothetical protein